MKKIVSLLSLLSITLLCLWACKQQDQPFGGLDNGLTSFSVTAGGVTYNAAIVDSRIVLSAPIGADLSSAVVKYELCEQATITPNPSSITDWNSEHVFRIKSFSKDARQYTYTVRRTDVSQAGNVQLLTQSDVENFAKLGITTIDGNLTIGADSKTVEDSIVNIEALASIKEVRYNIIVNRSFAGSTLKGLENIERCGAIHIGTPSTQILFPSQSGLSITMPKLKSVGDIIVNSSSVKSLSFDKLESVASLYISSNSLVALNLPQLKESVTTLSLTNSSTTNSILNEISLPSLVSVGTKLSIEGFSGVSDLKLPRLAYVGADLYLALNSGLLEKLSLAELSTINGSLIIEKAPGLLSLSVPKIAKLASLIYNKDSYGNYPLQTLDLPQLQTVDDEIYLRGMAIEQLTIPSLKSVGGDITFWDLKLATSIALPSIESVGNKIYFYSTTLLESFDISSLDTLAKFEIIGCTALKTVKSPVTIGDLTINYASSDKCPTPLFEGLKHVDGVLSFSSDYSTKIFDVANIQTIGTLKFGGGASDATLNLIDVQKIETFELSSSNIKTLNAPKLTAIDSWKISYCSKLTSINIPLLKTVGSLSLSEHNAWNSSSARMTNLDAYAGITSIGSVAISYCAKLYDFSGLSTTIPTLDAKNWSVTNCAYNPTYLDMTEGRYSKQP